MRSQTSVRSPILTAAVAVAALLSAASLGAQDVGRPTGGGGAALGASAGPPSAPAADSEAVARAVDRFHQALERGDSVAALALLAPDAVILESGGIESRAEYRSHHLPGDIEFARAVAQTRGPARVTVRGDAAWAVATSTVKGTFRGRPVDSVGAELMVLARTADGWRITAVHWSSRRRG